MTVVRKPRCELCQRRLTQTERIDGGTLCCKCDGSMRSHRAELLLTAYKQHTDTMAEHLEELYKILREGWNE